jgi:hypothetical protein
MSQLLSQTQTTFIKLYYIRSDCIYLKTVYQVHGENKSVQLACRLANAVTTKDTHSPGGVKYHKPSLRCPKYTELRAVVLGDALYRGPDNSQLSEGRYGKSNGDNNCSGALERLSAISGTEVRVSVGWWMYNLVIFHSTYDKQKTYVRVTTVMRECLWVTDKEEVISQAIP